MNINSIKQKVAQAIAKVPTTIVLQRDTWVDDGMGGRVKAEPTTVTTAIGLLDNSGHSFISPNVGEGGTVKRERTPKLVLVYEDTFSVQENDFFTVGGVTYRINNPVNILNLNIYWDCDVEVVR